MLFKFRKRRLAAAALSVCLGSALLSGAGVLAASGDADGDGIDDAVEAELIARYVPVYYFHPDEQYYADTVDAYLPNVQMRFHYRLLSDDQILDQGSVTQSALPEQVHANKDFMGNYTDEMIRSDSARDTFSDGGYFLEVPDDLPNREAVYRGNPEGDRTRVYAHAFRNDEGNISIQYWLFFPYNEAPSVAGVKLNHEGDWEHVTVRLNAEQTLDRVYFASHNNEGKAHAPSDLSFTTGDQTVLPYSEADGVTHPVVYQAKGTHASFPTAGTQYRGWYLPNDYTGEGVFFSGLDRAVNVGELDAPLNDQQFIRYGGLWGEIGVTPISTGPKTPSFQGSWMTD